MLGASANLGKPLPARSQHQPAENRQAHSKTKASESIGGAASCDHPDPASVANLFCAQGCFSNFWLTQFKMSALLGACLNLAIAANIPAACVFDGCALITSLAQHSRHPNA